MTPQGEPVGEVLSTRRDESPELRVLVVDHHPVVREGLRALLAAAEGITVVGQEATGRDSVRQALRHRPDVLITDLCPGLVTASRSSATPSIPCLYQNGQPLTLTGVSADPRTRRADTYQVVIPLMGGSRYCWQRHALISRALFARKRR
jgi:DNA-binding NarL/FixJ family response regulator